MNSKNNLLSPDFEPAQPLEDANNLQTGLDSSNGSVSNSQISGVPETIGDIPELTPKKKIYRPVDPFDPEIFNRNFRNK